MAQPKLNFSTEEDDKLIEAVAAHPAVYDLKNVLYKDQRAKDNIWIVIAGEVKRSVLDCKRRWKNVKDTYDRKNREIQRTGAKAPPLKKGKTWALQERLSFLRTLDNERETFCNVLEASETDDYETDNEHENSADPQQETPSTPLTSQPQATSSAESEMHSKKLPENQKKINYRERVYLAIEKRSKERDVMHLQQRAKLETLTLVSQIETDMWSSRSGNYASTQPNMLSALSPCLTNTYSSTYTDISRPSSTSNQSELGIALPLTNLCSQNIDDILDNNSENLQ